MIEKTNALEKQINRAATDLAILEPDDLQGLVRLIEVSKEMANTADADPGLSLFADVAASIESVLAMLMLFQIDKDEDKQNALELVGEGLASLQDVLRHLPKDPHYTGNVSNVLARIGTLTGKSDAEQTIAKPVATAPAVDNQETANDVVSSSSDVTLVLDPSLETDLVGEFVTEAQEHLDSIEENLLGLEDSPGDLEAINTIFRPFHTIKGVSGFLQLTPINHLAHETENLLDEARSGKLEVSPALIDVVLASVDLISKMVAEVSHLSANGGGTGSVFPVKCLVDRVQTVLSGQTEVPGGAPNSAPNNAQTIPEEVPVKAAATQAKISSNIKVDTEKLDNLLNMVGELVVAQLQVRQDPVIQSSGDQRLMRNLAQLSRITNELQKTAMSTRMVPIHATFQKMVRVVRDLSKKSGKAVELLLTGGDTEIDRRLVEEIYEPLMHMVRNSLDHGIENVAERQKTSKPATAQLRISAQHKGDAIMISIVDDGRGLNEAKIRSKAIEKGLISEHDQLDPKELYNLIFQPGFSTADKVTDVSGRGVGMDVVVKTIEKVRGKVEVDSAPGHGTTVTIRLPLTLAIIDGMVVRVGEEQFIIPTLSIMESFQPEEKDYATVSHQGEALKVRGKLVPLIRLSQLFNIESNITNPQDGLIVMVESEGQLCCLMVDALQGKQEIVIKSLGERMQAVDGVAGGAILGDGRIGLILDIGKIYRMAGACPV